MIPETALGSPWRQEQDPAGGGGHAPDEGVLDSLCQFAGGIAHDFNNLLTVINGYCQLLLSDPNAGKYAAYALEIFRAGEKAAEIVEMLMAYGGRYLLSKETFEVNGLLGKMRGFLTLFLGESISLNLRLCGRPCPVNGDLGQFQWALMSIFMNSKEAMPDGGRIDLETRILGEEEPVGADLPRETPRFEISIRDTGHGMPKEVLDRIFEPYFTTKHRSATPGQGLGLACTKGIVRQFGGSISAESAPGAGTVIRIRFPIAGPA